MQEADGNPATLYKYASAGGALAILRNRSIWWKSPVQFNDPFDTQMQLIPGHSVEGLRDGMVSRVADLMHSNAPLAQSMDANLRNTILTWRPLARFASKAQLLGGIRLGLEGKAEEIRQTVERSQQQWLDYVNNLRVLSVSETRDEILMWAHYADCHRGAVIELRSLPTGGALRGAFAIEYSEAIPEMASSEGWLDHVLGMRSIDFEGFFRKFAFTKSLDWRYEREWRFRREHVDSALDVPGMPQTWACPLLPDEIAAVYLGCRMTPADRNSVVDVVRATLPGTKILEAVKEKTRFALEFREVAGS